MPWAPGAPVWGGRASGLETTEGRGPGAEPSVELLPGHVCWELEGQEPGGQLSAAGQQELGF